MSGAITLKCSLIKNGTELYGSKGPIFLPGPVEPRFSRYLTFEGISVDEQGKQFHLDAHVSYRMACLAAIEQLKKFGYSGEQAYLLLSAAPVEGKIAGIVDVPNCCATVGLPLDIFDFDIRPVEGGPVKRDLGACATC
ncbi:Formamidase [Blyttiomyces helicus]|uniref:Formamidase n=1 Tax=Blyttiomyces helicus TaxID=388810 RepID=A0A4P9W923_9FUNG|nr:Formamidase [Blyttiomyces helicus]|eukprot:RKO89041.1 Formamidase [Blyttiomyces helicus]